MQELYIGNFGILLVLISPEDIINKNLKNELVDWDCC